MQPVRAAVAVLLAGVLTVGTAQGRTLDQVPGYLKQEGIFVTVPAYGMAGLGMAVGGLIGLPGSLISAPLGLLSGDVVGYALVPPAVTAAGGAELGYHLGGALPWLLKNAFYDAPMQGVARLKGPAANGLVAEVQPVELDPTRTQYLESTPPGRRVLLAQDNFRSKALPPPRDARSLILLKRRISPFKPPPGTPGGGPLTARVAPAVVAPVIPPRPALSVPPAPVVPAAPLSPMARVEPVLPTPLPSRVAPAAVVAPAPTPVEPVRQALSQPAAAAPVAAARADTLAPPAVPAVPPAEAVVPLSPPPVAAAAVAPAVVVPPAQPVVPEAVSRPAVNAEPSAEAGDGGGEERPSLQKKKKRKFSERFSF